MTEKDTFKSGVLEKHEAKKEEYRVWKETVQSACDDKDREAQAQIQRFEKERKQVIRSVHNNAAQGADVVPAAKVRGAHGTSIAVCTRCHGLLGAQCILCTPGADTPEMSARRVR